MPVNKFGINGKSSDKFKDKTVLISLDGNTIVYLAEVLPGGTTGKGVCLNSKHKSDIGLLSIGFSLSKFQNYEKPSESHWVDLVNKHFGENK